MAARLETWLGGRLDASPTVTVFDRSHSAGFSSETVPFRLTRSDPGGPRGEDLVLRLPPTPDAFPLFPTYDLDRQVRAMRLVGERSDVPVPAIRWYEPDPGPLGAPFVVMERIEGVAVPDMPPYVFGSWLTEASDEQRRLVERAMVDVLAGIHGVDGPTSDLELLELPTRGDTPLGRHIANQRAYYGWIADEAGCRFPVIERTFEWLDERWPDDEGPAVVSWGDARLANVLFLDFEPVAVLDWEAAALGPRELDLGWFLFFHQYFQRVAARYGHRGLPDFLEPARVVAAYEARTGHSVRRLDWFLVYAELRQALTSIRVSSRAMHFGERAAPADPQDLIIDRAHLEEVVGL